MRKWLFPLALAALVGACGSFDGFGRSVSGREPTYCYQSIGGVECYHKPYFRDERRLVNYVGPPPGRYEKPLPPPPAPHSPPAMIDYWVKDPEPLPRPAALAPGMKAAPAPRARADEAPPPLAAPVPPVVRLPAH